MYAVREQPERQWNVEISKLGDGGGGDILLAPWMHGGLGADLGQVLRILEGDPLIN